MPSLLTCVRAHIHWLQSCVLLLRAHLPRTPLHCLLTALAACTCCCAGSFGQTRTGTGTNGEQTGTGWRTTIPFAYTAARGFYVYIPYWFVGWFWCLLLAGTNFFAACHKQQQPTFRSSTAYSACPFSSLPATLALYHHFVLPLPACHHSTHSWFFSDLVGLMF